MVGKCSLLEGKGLMSKDIDLYHLSWKKSFPGLNFFSGTMKGLLRSSAGVSPAPKVCDATLSFGNSAKDQ